MVRVLLLADTHLGFDLPARPRVERARRLRGRRALRRAPRIRAAMWVRPRRRRTARPRRRRAAGGAGERSPAGGGACFLAGAMTSISRREATWRMRWRSPPSQVSTARSPSAVPGRPASASRAGSDTTASMLPLRWTTAGASAFAVLTPQRL
jgi:hypothetical protein